MRAEDYFRERERTDPEFARAWAEEQPSSNLGINLYRLRKQLGLTQGQLGELAGLSQPKIAKLERGDGSPNLRTVGRLAYSLRVSPGALLADPYREIVADREAAARSIIDAVLEKSRVETIGKEPAGFSLEDWAGAPKWGKRRSLSSVIDGERLHMAG